jgi:hypothetical protein
MCIPLSFLGNAVATARFGKNPRIVARQQLGRNVTAVTNTRNNRKIVGHVVLNVSRVVSRKVGKKNRVGL